MHEWRIEAKWWSMYSNEKEEEKDAYEWEMGGYFEICIYLYRMSLIEDNFRNAICTYWFYMQSELAFTQGRESL